MIPRQRIPDESSISYPRVVEPEPTITEEQKFLAHFRSITPCQLECIYRETDTCQPFLDAYIPVPNRRPIQKKLFFTFEWMKAGFMKWCPAKKYGQD